jgi:hypothetical protein
VHRRSVVKCSSVQCSISASFKGLSSSGRSNVSLVTSTTWLIFGSNTILSKLAPSMALLTLKEAFTGRPKRLEVSFSAVLASLKATRASIVCVVGGVGRSW